MAAAPVACCCCWQQLLQWLSFRPHACPCQTTDLASLLAPLPPVPELDDEEAAWQLPSTSAGPAGVPAPAAGARGAAATAEEKAALLEAAAEQEMQRVLSQAGTVRAGAGAGLQGQSHAFDSPSLSAASSPLERGASPALGAGGVEAGGGAWGQDQAALRDLLAAATEGLFGSSTPAAAAAAAGGAAAGGAAAARALTRESLLEGAGGRGNQGTFASVTAGLFDDTLSSLGSDTVSSSVDRLLFGSLLEGGDDDVLLGYPAASSSLYRTTPGGRLRFTDRIPTLSPSTQHGGSPGGGDLGALGVTVGALREEEVMSSISSLSLGSLPELGDAQGELKAGEEAGSSDHGRLGASTVAGEFEQG